MKIWVSPYTLIARAPLSGRAQNRERHGALLKVETQDGVGFSDLHPWTELGDASLVQELQRLRDGRPMVLGSRALEIASLDRQARSQAQSAFFCLGDVPESHRLIALTDLSANELSQVALAGFKTLKIKIGVDLSGELAQLTKLAPALAPFRLRLDANAQLTAKTYLDWIARLPIDLVSSIEFVEDPVAVDRPAQWSQVIAESKVPLAIDRATEAELQSLKSSWLILKPAAQQPAKIMSSAKARHARVAVTSYLDHPLGQVAAALETARLLQSANEVSQLIGICGFSSHLSYEVNAFSEALRFQGPRFLPPEGTGLGFDRLLGALPWRPLQ